jgi:hypothetical protein
MPKPVAVQTKHETLAPEVLLVGAVLARAVADAQSHSPGIQAEAVRFLANRQDLDLWCDLGGIDPDAFVAKVAALLRRREA